MSFARPGKSIGERQPEPQVIARRLVELPLHRTLEISAIEDGAGRLDVWLRMRTGTSQIVGQLHLKPTSLRAIADELAAVAAELGVEP